MAPKKFIITFLALALLPLSSCAQAKFNPAEPPAHDPVVIACDGTWYLFSTGWGVNIYSSPDRQNWTKAGSVFDNPPEWAVETIPGFKGHIWAPD
nr:arabinan endo-1,5-alpha-L-arabinosidase [Bacteroidales bacterium]